MAEAQERVWSAVRDFSGGTLDDRMSSIPVAARAWAPRKYARWKCQRSVWRSREKPIG